MHKFRSIKIDVLCSLDTTYLKWYYSDNKYSITKEELLKYRLRKHYFYATHFYFYNKENNIFHLVEFLSHNVEGYITTDGIDFSPFSTDEMSIYYLDKPMFQDWIKFEAGADYDNEKFARAIDKEWLKLYPDKLPIRTVEELEDFCKYDFWRM